MDRCPLTLLWMVVVFILPSAGLQADENLVELDRPQYIKRIAMDLLGGRPSQSDLLTPESGIPALVDRYMTTEAFAERMIWLANDIFLTRFDEVEYFRDSYDYSNENIRYDVAKAVGEEPLRLLQYIVLKDRPLTELVTADYTIANATLASFWGIDYSGGSQGEDWLPGRYRDGREHAGVISQNGFYYRYPSTLSNKQRHRANQITRIFLDDDHFLRNVSLDLRLGAADPNLNLLDATRFNRGCVACHDTLDGIGAHLYGFSTGPEGSRTYARETFGTFSQQGVQRSQLETVREPSFYGFPSRGLKDLGNYISKDPRFAQTMMKHIYRFLLHRNLDYRDRDLMIHFADILRSSGFSTKALLKAIIASGEYRAIGVVGGSLKKDKVAEALEPTPDSSAQWHELEEKMASADIPDPSRVEVVEMIRIHAIQSGYSQQLAQARGSRIPKDAFPTAIDPHPPEEIIQPFKLATPEQLHSLGEQLLGEVWSGWEGGQWLPREFPHLEYNSDIKVAAGGYDGKRILERRWSVPPTYMLVVERWAEVMAEDILEHELGESVPWSQRRVFSLITGKEEPYEAEPAIRAQIVDWFKRFYCEEVSPSSPEVNDVFGVLLQAREQAKTKFGNWFSIEVAWSHVLGMMLSDPKIAIY